MTIGLSGALAPTKPAQAESRISLIRDAEIENTIHAFAKPLLQAGNLDPATLKIHLVNNPTLNAFVSHGMNLFIHTGLLMRVEDPSELIGVMAHEFGHIIGGHIILRQAQIESAQKKMWLSYVLGAAAALATGRSDAFVGVALGTQSAIAESVMSFSRSEESQADQAGTELMDKIGMSCAGLLKFMRILQGQELLVTTSQDPYLRTHPLTRDRVKFIENHVAAAGLPADTVPAEWKRAYARIRAKLFGFMEATGRTLQRYPESDDSIPARYGRAIALYRQADTAQAVKMIDGLLAQVPGDPYFLELKGQVLFESGNVAAAIPPYRESVRVAPDNPPILLGLARALITDGTPPELAEAAEALRRAIRLDPDDPPYWKQLAIARGRAGFEAEAAYAMAEYTVQMGNYREARFQAGKALQGLPAGTPMHLRAEDILAESEIQLQKKRTNTSGHRR